MHTKIHTGDHIRCPICSKIFQTHAKLRAHERIHSEEVEEEREDGEDDISDYMSEGEEDDDWWPSTIKNLFLIWIIENFMIEKVYARLCKLNFQDNRQHLCYLRINFSFKKQCGIDAFELSTFWRESQSVWLTPSMNQYCNLISRKNGRISSSERWTIW